MKKHSSMEQCQTCIMNFTYFSHVLMMKLGKIFQFHSYNSAIYEIYTNRNGIQV